MSAAENLKRWKDSSRPRAWVEAHKGGWNHADWLSLLEELQQSEYWPMEPSGVGQVLEGLKQEYREQSGTAVVRCPSCGRASQVPNQLTAKPVKCPHCDTVFAIGADTPLEGPSRGSTGPLGDDELDQLYNQGEWAKIVFHGRFQRRATPKMAIGVLKRLQEKVDSGTATGIDRAAIALLNRLPQTISGSTAETQGVPEATVPSAPDSSIEYADVLLDPAAFHGKAVRIRGTYRDLWTCTGNFKIVQGSHTISVYYSQLSKEQKRLILRENEAQGRTVTVDGVLQGTEGCPDLIATSVSIDGMAATPAKEEVRPAIAETTGTMSTGIPPWQESLSGSAKGF